MAMQSRRDLFQAHRLMTQRAALALLRGEPDVPDQPLRRLNIGTIAGVLVGVIVAGIFGIWGLLFHGAPALRYEPGTLVMDKQTGASYVFCGNSHQDLCPEVNYASALLALGSPAVTVQDVNQSSLTNVPRGPLLGIPGLPADLPGKGLLITKPWSVCGQTLTGVAGAPGGQQATTVVASGVQPGGQPLGNSLLLVSSPSLNQNWVIGNSPTAGLVRMQIDQNTLSGLFPSASPVSVPSAWLNALPLGSQFEAPNIPDYGKSVNGPDGQAQVGQVYQAQVSGSTQYYVTQENGTVASITQTQEELLQAEPKAPQLQTLTESQIVPHESPKLPNALPVTETSVANPGTSAAVCVLFSGTGPSVTMQVETGGVLPSGGVSTNAPPGSPLLADQIALPSGKGALVRYAGDPDANSASYALVTSGIKYPLASVSVVSDLGYSASQAVQLPAGVLDMIPSGPGFNPQQAQEPALVGG
jgi:type VII secretion protein EccB